MPAEKRQQEPTQKEKTRKLYSWLNHNLPRSPVMSVSELDLAMYPRLDTNVKDAVHYSSPSFYGGRH